MGRQFHFMTDGKPEVAFNYPGVIYETRAIQFADFPAVGGK